MDDRALLRQFVDNQSDDAFAALVARHVNLVYSVAMRQLGNPHHAEEITQAVFIILARKAARLREANALSSWLFQATRLTATNFVRSEARRHRREEEAHMQSILNEPDGELWSQIAPLLDTAVASLREKDRQAIVLRFYEGRNLREVGEVLGTSEDAAEKRVSRALEKLRKIFAKRGVILSACVLAGAISGSSVQAAPPALATTVAAAAVGKGAAAGGSTLALVKGAMRLMAWTNAKTAILVGAGLLLAAATTSVVVSRPAQDREAAEILNRVAQKYASLSTYSDTGKTVELIDNKTITGWFSMRLGRGDLYLVEYEQKDQDEKGNILFTNRGAVWSDGTGDYFANDMPIPVSVAPGPGTLNTNKVVKMPFPGPAHGMSLIKYVSGGATVVVPTMFFDIQIPRQEAWSKLLQPAQWAKAPDEKVGETDCYVVSAETDDGKVLLWIGKEDLLVHQTQQRVVEKDKLPLPETTDAQVAEMLAKIPGASATPLPAAEIKRRINEGTKKATASKKPVTVVFSDDKSSPGLKSMTIQPPGVIVYTQTHENIVLNQKFSPSDFTRPPATRQ